MEPRAGVAQYDKERQHWTLYTPSQGVFGMRDIKADPNKRLMILNPRSPSESDLLQILNDAY